MCGLQKKVGQKKGRSIEAKGTGRLCEYCQKNGRAIVCVSGKQICVKCKYEFRYLQQKYKAKNKAKKYKNQEKRL